MRPASRHPAELPGSADIRRGLTHATHPDCGTSRRNGSRPCWLRCRCRSTASIEDICAAEGLDLDGPTALGYVAPETLAVHLASSSDHRTPAQPAGQRPSRRSGQHPAHCPTDRLRPRRTGLHHRASRDGVRPLRPADHQRRARRVRAWPVPPRTSSSRLRQRGWAGALGHRRAARQG